jgi:hypothetical protein
LVESLVAVGDHAGVVFIRKVSDGVCQTGKHHMWVDSVRHSRNEGFLYLDHVSGLDKGNVLDAGVLLAGLNERQISIDVRVTNNMYLQ